MNLREIVLERTLPKEYEDRIARKRFNSLSHYFLVHKFIPMLQAMKIPDAKAGVDKEWEELEKLPAWRVTEVRIKREITERAKNSSFCNADGHRSSQKFGVGTPILDIRRVGRVVLRGDTVKDESRSYAVSTEQRSFKSQMTATKVMDVIARLQGCAGQAANAVSAYAKVKMERRFSIMEPSQVRMSRFLDTSTTTRVAQILVQH